MNLTHKTWRLCAQHQLCAFHRAFSTSCVLQGRRNRLRQNPKLKFIKFYQEPHPFDERFYISSKDVSRYKEHGSEWAEKYVEERYEFAPQKPGYQGARGFKVVPEMIPEFIVPDLTDFKLRPYVTYNVSNIIQQSEFTVRDLFLETYGKDVIDKYANKPDDLQETPEELLEKSKYSKGKTNL